MSPYILDTDTMSLYQRGFPNVVARVDARNPSERAITVITVEEEITGWYRLLRKVRGPDEQIRAYERLAEAIPHLARWRIIPMSLPTLLRDEALARMMLKLRKIDLRIAAIVLGASAILVSRNLRDFRCISNLVVEDWAS